MSGNRKGDDTRLVDAADDRHRLDDGDPNDPAYLRQLLATAEALDPDPYGEQA